MTGLGARPSGGIPEGWFAFTGGFSLGEVEGTVVTSDGLIYTADTVEIDLSVPARLLWRFWRAKGSAQKGEKGLIPVRRAYMSLLDFLGPSPVLAKEWEGTAFVPTGAHSSRALLVGLNDDSITGRFFEKASEWFSDFSSTKSPVWDEAVSAVNLIPDSLSSVS